MQHLPKTYLERARHIFADVDTLLGQARHVLDPLEMTSPFHGSSTEVPPVTFQVLRDSGLQLRSAMAQMLRNAGIAVQVNHLSRLESGRRLVEHAITIAAGLSPEHWDADEALSEEARQDARRWASVVLGALQATATELDDPTPLVEHRTVNHSRGTERTTGPVNLAMELRVVAQRHGLRHVRRQLDILVRRHNGGELRIAVAGRCNVGKSSLINHLLARPVLPTGSLPTTSVPVHLRYGPRTRGEVHFANAAVEQFEVERLPEFADTRANPDNRRHVQSVSLEVNNPDLESDVVWIDMPPLDDDPAALASFAFLDELLACHVVVLAASAIVPVWNVEAQLIERLCKAGVRVLVLLTKADLLPDERLMVHEACMTAIWQTTGVRAPIGMVSVKGDTAGMSDTWRDTILRQVIHEVRDNEDGAQATAMLALRMMTLAELERRSRVLSACAAQASDSGAIEAATALVLASYQREDTENLADKLFHQIVQSTAHNAAGLVVHDDSDTLDLSDMLAATANALASSEAMSWWKELLALRAQVSLLIAQSPEDAWRWPQMAAILPVPRVAPPFDCRVALPQTQIHRPSVGDLGRWVSSHAIAKRLLSHPTAAWLRTALGAHLAMLHGWRSGYLDALDTSLRVDDTVDRSDALLQFRRQLSMKLAQDIALLRPH